MSAALELLKLYLDLSMWMAIFFFGRATKDTDEVLAAAVVSLGLGVLWPLVIWQSLTSTPEDGSSQQNKDPSHGG